MPRISAVLIVRDEAQHLRPCLAPLAPVADELIVVDTGSTDGSIDIARAMGAHLFTVEWCDDFAAARNFACSCATGDYVLSVDADEYLQEPEKARARLLDFIATYPPETTGTVEIMSLTGMDLQTSRVTDHLPRFFHRTHYHYTGMIHEQLTLKEGIQRGAPTGLRFEHHGYDRRVANFKEKTYRNIKLLRKALSLNPNDEYYWYQLGKAHFSLNRFQSAASAFEKALRCIHFSEDSSPTGCQGNVARSVLTGVVVTLAYACINLDQLPRALALLEQHRALGHAGTRRSDFYFALGYAYLQAGRIQASRDAFLCALEYGAAKEDVVGTGSYRALYHLGLLAEADGAVDQALSWYHKALSINASCQDAIKRITSLAAENAVIKDSEHHG